MADTLKLPLGTFGVFQDDKTLINTLINVLESVNEKKSESFRIKVANNKQTRSFQKKIIEQLQHALNKHAPIFTYVGHNPADESNWGVWVDLEALHKAESKRIVQQGLFSSCKKSRSRYVLMHDEGLRLFQRKNWVAIWSV